jgi:hypothetical protein
MSPEQGSVVMRIGVVVAGAAVVLGSGVRAAADPVDRAGTLGIAYFEGLTPLGEQWYTTGFADFNGDGHADVVGIRADSRRIGIVLTRPGGYDPVVTLDLCDYFGTGELPVATGDVDGNGIPEILVADENGRRVWAVPFADGAFGSGWWIDTGEEPPEHFPFDAMLDLDSDGKDDLTFTRSGELVAVLSGSPGVAFVRATATVLFEAFTDLTGDGVADVIDLADGLVRVFPGGVQGFSEVVEIDVSPGHVSVVDLDGDGAADLIGSDATAGEGWIRRNEGGGAFANETRFAAGVEFRSLISVGDIDGSGLPDVVAVIRRPGQSFGAAHVWNDPWLGVGLDSVGLISSAPGYSLRDLDGDGLQDLVALRFDETYGHLNRGGPPPVGTLTTSLDADPLDVRAGDFDADGHREIVICEFNGLSLWRRQPDGSYAREELASGDGVRFMSVPADLDGDGALDLAVSARGGGVEVWPGGPAGLGSSPVGYSFDQPSLVWQIAVGDVTGDGLADVVAADRGAGLVRVLVGVAGGLPETVESFEMNLATAVALLDLDGDGVMEVVVSGEAEYVIRGFKRVAGAWQVVSEKSMNGRPYWLTAGDLDGDGWSDLAVGFDFPFDSSVQILYGADSGLSDPVDIGPAFRPTVDIAMADINGDGRLDLLLAPWTTSSFASGMIDVMLQTETRAFGFGGRLPGFSAGGVAAADLNNDGVVDIASVCHNGSIDLLQIHLGRSLPCPVDLNSDGTLNFFDVAAFLSLFNAGDPVADFAEPFGVLNFFDLAAFLVVYNAGCP